MGNSVWRAFGGEASRNFGTSTKTNAEDRLPLDITSAAPRLVLSFVLTRLFRASGV